jgi:hypothetical protein
MLGRERLGDLIAEDVFADPGSQPPALPELEARAGADTNPDSSA